MLRGNNIEIIKMCGGINFEMFVFSCRDVQANMLNSCVSLFHNLLRLRDFHPIFYPPETSAFERENFQIVNQRNCVIPVKQPSFLEKVVILKGDQLHHHV